MDSSRFSGMLGAVWGPVRGFARAHRFWSVVIALVVLYGGYRAYAAYTAPSAATRYVTTTVATGTVVATMTESGQVSASHQLGLSPKASGEVVGIYVKPGQHVAAGQLIAALDATDAKTALTDAELSLETAKLTYAQTTATSTLALNELQAENGVTNAQTSLQKTHDSTYASLASIYTDLSSLVTSLDHVLHDSQVPGRATQENVYALSDAMAGHDDSINIFANTAERSYNAAVTAYNAALVKYKATSLSSTNDELVSLAGTTYDAATAVTQAVKDTRDFLDRLNTDYTLYNLTAPNILSSLTATIVADTATVNGDLSAALTAKTNIISAEQALAVAQNALEAVKGGSNALTVQQAALTLKRAQEAVNTAKQNLRDYYVYAPFAGTIASVGVQTYDQASSGTTVATIVTDKQTVDISVNEIDASKLSVGEKATLTFDALSGVTVAGTVSSVNAIGSVSQGVVSYDATITFDTPNPKVLPGMSATADIIVGSATGLVVPGSAVKTSGTRDYVEVFNPPLAGSESPTGAESPVAPTSVPVTTGLSNDTDTIITSGLSAGDQVVTQTVTGTGGLTGAAQSTSAFGSGNRTNGGVFRAIGR